MRVLISCGTPAWEDAWASLFPTPSSEPHIAAHTEHWAMTQAVVVQVKVTNCKGSQEVSWRWAWQWPCLVPAWVGPVCVQWSPSSCITNSTSVSMNHKNNFSVSHQGEVSEAYVADFLLSQALHVENIAKIPDYTQVTKQICRVYLKYPGSF